VLSQQIHDGTQFRIIKKSDIIVLEKIDLDPRDENGPTP
jgi:hypothetical protein